MKLRDYQTECVEDVFKLWEGGSRGTLLHLATGLGKTVCMAEVQRRIRNKGGRVLVVAHLRELLDSASATFKFFNPHDTHYFERGEDHIPATKVNQRAVGVAFAMVQSIHKRLRKYPSNYFSHIFIDETHRGVASTYLKVVRHFSDAKILGVTATPKRADKVGLKLVFDEVCQSSMSVTEGIGMGWLVPFRPTSYYVKSLDFSDCTQKGDLTEEQIERKLKANGQMPLHEIAAGLKDQADGLQSIVFLSGVDNARELARIMREHYHEPVDFICGETDYEVRASIIERYRKGELLRIINVGVLTEGVDLPNTQCVAIARVTRSEGRYLQMAGRGTRPYPGGIVDLYETPEDRVNAIAASCKPECLLLDFKGNMGRVRPCIDGRDLLSGLMPHKPYGGQPTPSLADVKRVGSLPGNERLTIEELRQRASDDLLVQMMLARDDFSLRAKVKEAEIKQHKDLFGIPWQPERNVDKEPQPCPVRMRSYPEQRAKIIRLHERLGIEPPTTAKLNSLSRKGARKKIEKLLVQIGEMNTNGRR